MNNIPGSDIDVFSFRHLSPFQDCGPFNDVTTRQIITFYSSSPALMVYKIMHSSRNQTSLDYII